MDAFLNFLQPYDLHPVIDHFTIGLLMVGVVIDLAASLFPSLSWPRYTALTMMILGALFAGGSYLTGDLEADRVWKALGDPAKAVLQRHAQLAMYAAIVFGVLALWRILIQAIGAFAGSRPVYLIFAFLAICVLGYIGHLGGVLVYTYAVGTDAMAAAQQTPTPAETPAAPGPLALPTATTMPSAIPPMAATGVPMVATPSPTGPATPSASPTVTPDGV